MNLNMNNHNNLLIDIGQQNMSNIKIMCWAGLFQKNLRSIMPYRFKLSE
jgi:patatin-like phospholipase/acyl hydrolase